MSESSVATQIVPLKKLSKDIKQAAATMDINEARYLVDLYYQMQAQRIRAAGQIRAMEQAETQEPHETLSWVNAQSGSLEDSIKSVLGEYAKGKAVGRWSQGICGIGPVLSAGLIAYIDLARVDPVTKEIGERQAVAGIWRYAGYDPTVTWGKGEKRPWNNNLKVLCWKIGESFVKVSGNENDVYGKFAKQKKAYYQEMNDKGAYVDAAREKLERFNIGKSTDAYKWYAGCYPAGTTQKWAELNNAAWDAEAIPTHAQSKETTRKIESRAAYLKRVELPAGEGLPMLPPAHIQARANRWAVKLFLSHWFEVAYFDRHGHLPPKPYAIGVLGHCDYVKVPMWPWTKEVTLPYPM